MTLAETCELVATVQALWPRWPLAAETPDVWHPLLERFDADVAEAAVRELAAEGREGAPPVGVIVRTIIDRQTDLPEWDEAQREIERAVRTYMPPRGTVVESGGRPAPPADYWSHPLLASFMHGAWNEWRFVAERDRRTFLAQQRDAYQAYRARVRRDAGLLALGAPRRRTLARIDALRQLPGVTVASQLVGPGKTSEAINPGSSR